MERRKQNRLHFESDLVIRLLGDDPCDLPGRMMDVSADGMRFDCARPVAPGTAIRIDREDGMILGEVCHCSTLADGVHSIGILFHQVLSNLRDLEPLLRTLHSYETEARAANKPASTVNRRSR